MPVHLVADVVFSGRGIATTFGCSLKFIKGEVFIKRSRIVIGRVYYRLVIVFELRFMTEKLCGLICRCRPVADIYYIVRHKVAVTSRPRNPDIFRHTSSLLSIVTPASSGRISAQTHYK